MLYERAGGLTRPLAEAVLADFAVHPDGSRLVVVRPTDDPDSALLLLDRAGRLLRRLDPGEGTSSLPIFTPDGRAVVFVSGATGVAAFWRAGLEGRAPVQLTNRDARPGDLGAGFVPPPNGRAGMRFVDDTTLRYDTGEGPWLLDVETGRASPGAAR